MWRKTKNPSKLPLYRFSVSTWHRYLPEFLQQLISRIFLSPRCKRCSFVRSGRRRRRLRLHRCRRRRRRRPWKATTSQRLSTQNKKPELCAIVASVEQRAHSKKHQVEHFFYPSESKSEEQFQKVFFEDQDCLKKWPQFRLLVWGRANFWFSASSSFTFYIQPPHKVRKHFIIRGSWVWESVQPDRLFKLKPAI